MLSIDRLSRVPVYEQVIDGVEREIIAGLLCAGDKLPSVREMSLTLGINPNTIQKAYAELDRRGVIVTLPARGAFVAENALDVIRNQKQRLLGRVRELALELLEAGVEEKVVVDEIRAAYASKENILSDKSEEKADDQG
ncbi:MAG: GntR family transcriptional regulator [Clostridia bacterium]|nr:GntR family transcriptional regulator [Clostridia bacterium]MBP3369337.1 GntR family transcriptional regulator [Clostridia bacterium]